ncbi:MAG TPA: response regulator [Candidatus Krumholzibacteria bacterium]|nr:response regulator [Candidatus Krumholzibacteria bacterium]
MKRILIADDDASIRHLLEAILKPVGAQVVSCGDGLEALAALRAEPFDLLITDIVMPVMDGRQLAQVVLSDPDLRIMPILVTSGIVSGREIGELLRLGVVGFLAKPLNLAAVRSDVSACLDGIATPAI